MKNLLRFLSPRVRFLALRHFRIAIPISLQILLRFLVHVTDTVVVGQLGETEIAGVAIAGQIFFVFLLFMFGISSGAASVFSQCWGKKALDSMQKTFGFLASLAFIGGIFYWIGASALAPGFLKLFSKDPAVHTISMQYLSIVLISYPLQGFSTVGISLFQSLERSGKMLPVIFWTVAINIVLDILLVFGLFGLPRMGVAGSALATLIAMTIQAIWVAMLLFGKTNPITMRVAVCIRWSKQLIMQTLRVVTPVVANEVGFAFGHLLYFIVIGWYGTKAIAAYNITYSVFDILLVGCLGSGEACTVIIGKLIGAGKFRSLENYLRFLIPFVLLFSGLMAGIGALLSPFIPHVFSIDASTKTMVTYMILVFSPFIMVGMMNLHLVTGVFRGGADTSYAMKLELGTLWLIGIPLTFLVGSIFDVSIYVLFLCIGSEEVVRMILSLRRMRTRKWIRSLNYD